LTIAYKGQGTLITGGGTTLTELKTICKYSGWRDTTDTGELALTRFINDTIYILSTLAPWPEYLKLDGEQAMADGTDEYVLDEVGIDRLGVVERSTATLPLGEITPEEWLIKKRTLSYTGSPLEYAVQKGLAGGVSTITMLVYPCPSTVETLYYSYFRKPTEMVDGSDIADWPNSRAWLITDALSVRLSKGIKDTSGFSLHSTDFMQKVYRAMGDSRGSYLPVKVRQCYDNRKIRIRDCAFKVQD
jgi:hypothetical protein